MFCSSWAFCCLLINSCPTMAVGNIQVMFVVTQSREEPVFPQNIISKNQRCDLCLSFLQRMDLGFCWTSQAPTWNDTLSPKWVCVVFHAHRERWHQVFFLYKGCDDWLLHIHLRRTFVVSWAAGQNVPVCIWADKSFQVEVLPGCVFQHLVGALLWLNIREQVDPKGSCSNSP